MRAVVAGVALLSLGGAFVVTAQASGSPSAPLIGTFKITAGSCASTTLSGSYFRMIQPGGTASGGPFVKNADSPCRVKSVTPLAPGTDGGLTTERYQAAPKPSFSVTGGGRAQRITQPQRFFGVYFATATNLVDPQTKQKTQLPSISVDVNGRLSGDLSAFAVTWNRQNFNQGAPKPDGTTPGLTTPVSGSYNKVTRRFTIVWVSQIVGGPFNNFAGLWVLTGTFSPA